MLNVTACDKSSGKTEKITIKNDKGRLSKEQIEDMVKEAERLKQEDEANMKRVEAKNKLESYIYNWRNQLDNKEVADKIGQANVELVTTCVKEAQTWLDANTTATTEEFEGKYKEYETQLKNVVTQMYGGSGPSGIPTPTPTPNHASAEEVD